jgi:hypothetical protein
MNKRFSGKKRFISVCGTQKNIFQNSHSVITACIVTETQSDVFNQRQAVHRLGTADTMFRPASI